MNTIILQFPDNTHIDEKEAKITLAAGLYKKGRLTMGQAAELSGFSKKTFMELLADYDTDIFHYPPEELDNDLSNARDHSF